MTTCVCEALRSSDCQASVAERPEDSQRRAVHGTMPADFVNGIVESGRWRNLMDTLPAKAAAMGMSPEDADGRLVHLAQDWVLPILKFVTK